MLGLIKHANPEDKTPSIDEPKGDQPREDPKGLSPSMPWKGIAGGATAGLLGATISDLLEESEVDKLTDDPGFASLSKGQQVYLLSKARKADSDLWRKMKEYLKWVVPGAATGGVLSYYAQPVQGAVQAGEKAMQSAARSGKNVERATETAADAIKDISDVARESANRALPSMADAAETMGQTGNFLLTALTGSLAADAVLRGGSAINNLRKPKAQAPDLAPKKSILKRPGTKRLGLATLLGGGGLTASEQLGYTDLF